MHCCRNALLFFVLSVFLTGDSLAQKKKKPGSEDEGYIPIVAPENKQKKKKEDEITQTLPPPVELPSAVTAETDRLAFAISPLSGKGLLSQQVRDALKALQRTNHGTIVKLRAFVAGSGDLRRVGELVGDTFTEKHMALPVLSVIQVGALPMEGAQVVIESTEMDKKAVNPHGVAFVAGQNAASVAQSLAKLRSALSGAGLDASDALRVTCFVSSLEEQRDTRQLMAAGFPGAVLNYVQMQREPVSPAAECEAVARLRAPAAAPVSFLNPSELEKSPNYSQVALVKSAKLVITGTQLAFGSQEADIKLAFERMLKVLNSSNARFDQLVMSHTYVTSSGIIPRVRSVRAGYYSAAEPPASTLLPFEALPSIDASFGVDVIAAADAAGARR
jgi:enamine deaminase RidA (YjgF/YER057c/UK114 family)